MTVYLLNLVNEMHSLTANHVDNLQLIAMTRTIDAAITTRTNMFMCSATWTSCTFDYEISSIHLDPNTIVIS